MIFGVFQRILVCGFPYLVVFIKPLLQDMGFWALSQSGFQLASASSDLYNRSIGTVPVLKQETIFRRN